MTRIPTSSLSRLASTGPDPGAGKFEIAVQADRLQINGRNAEVGPIEGFETIVVFHGRQRVAISVFGFPEAKIYKKFGKGKGVIVIANASVAPS